jgi:hypothetical protein|tara:strand:- start:7062 stop:7265 length:204 start_codon:yes stop_codon:yes gene_type:complete
LVGGSFVFKRFALRLDRSHLGKKVEAKSLPAPTGELPSAQALIPIVLNAESVGLNHSRFALLIEGQE